MVKRGPSSMYVGQTQESATLRRCENGFICMCRVQYRSYLYLHGVQYTSAKSVS